MTGDTWWWAALGGAVGIGTAAREIIGLGLRFLGHRAKTRQSDAEVGHELRDELREEIRELRVEVRAVREQLKECEERSAGIERELGLRAQHAEKREQRISQLEDKVRRLETRQDGRP